MKKLILLATLSSLSACTGHSYRPEEHCSEEGLNQLKLKTVNKSTEAEKEKMTATLREQFKAHSKEIISCYQTYINQGFYSNYSVCTVMNIKNGKLAFLDVADKNNNLNEDLQKCIKQKLEALDYTFLKKLDSVIVHQPYHLHPRRVNAP